jgi:hypothetical protein
MTDPVFKDLATHKHYALVVTDGEVGGIEQIHVDAADALEIWDLNPIVVPIPDDMKGKVIGGWYYRNGTFVPASER